MGLTAHIGLRLGTLDLDAELQASDAQTVAIVGPNGAGKSTLLRAIAGLSAIDRGLIQLDGDVLDNGKDIFVPPERRPIAMVFQDYLLFPHLSAIDNVAFGLRSRGTPRAKANARALELLERVGLTGKARAKPDQLSGGQAQRVALARALAIQPRLLLLDEPLAALDASTRVATRRDLARHLEGFHGVRLLVTHDPLDAAVLADRLVILEQGNITQTGTLDDISSHPRSDYAAELVDVNLLRGTAQGDRVTLTTGANIVVTQVGTGPAFVVIHPRSIALYRTPPTGSPRNIIAGRVDSSYRLGDRTRVRISGDIPLVAEITTTASDEMTLTPGAPIWAAVKATDITVFPA